MSERVRREIRDLVEGFGPPRPGLAARAVAGLPDRGRRPRVHWAVAAAAVLTVAAGLVLGLTVRTARPPAPAPAGVAQLQRRPLADVPLASPSCQVDGRRASVRQVSGTVTYVSASPVPLDGLMTLQVTGKPAASSTVGVVAGGQVTGPVLVRGHRLDGPGTMRFTLAPAARAVDRRELTLDVTPRTRRWDVGIQASRPGCYAIQFDGADFSEQAVVLLYSSAGGLVPGGRTMSPAQAGAQVRAAVTAARPVLLPGAVVAADWRAEVTAATDGFSVEYDDPTGTRSVVVSIGDGPLPAGATAELAPPQFHGDPRSRYRASDADPRGARILTWHEPGTYDRADPAYPGVPYTLSARGLTDAEFWQVASSLG